MKSFINVQDIGPLEKAMAEAFEIKKERFKYQHLGKNKTLMMIFFNGDERHCARCECWCLEAGD